MEKLGISLIGLPGSGKSTLARAIIKKLPGWTLHDQDTDGLESDHGLGKDGVRDIIRKDGDSAFLAYEASFTLEKYGNRSEGKIFTLDTMLLASSGSLILSEAAITHIRKRTHTILIETPICVALRQIEGRSDTDTRIVGLNGGPNEKPRSNSLEEELISRESLYQKYADVSLGYHPWESLEITTDRLYRIIQNLVVL